MNFNTPYYWSTNEPHADNYETSWDFTDCHLPKECKIIDGWGETQLLIMDGENNLWQVDISGNGDFCNHMAQFTRHGAIK
jgi:hypothetical protein